MSVSAPLRRSRTTIILSAPPFSWQYGDDVKQPRRKNHAADFSHDGGVDPVCVRRPSFAQEWIQYASKADLFGVNFPVEPKVQDITYATEYEITLPGRVYSADSGPSRYSVTVVDYQDAEKIHTEQAEQCRKKGGEADACTNNWRADVQGSMIYASWKFLQRNAKVTYYAWAVSDNVEGQRLQLTNPDGSRTFAAIYRHGTRLYIAGGDRAPGRARARTLSAVVDVA